LVRPKADVDCVAVAAASLVAKVSRDELMVELAERFPRWPAFATSAGYGTAAHAEQIRAAGLSSEHRVSWSFAARLAPADPLIVSGR
jgi:ribonuclease HII